MNTISDSTPLIPEIIAEMVVKSFPLICLVYVEEKEAANFLCQKAERIFQNNKAFWQKLNGRKCREHLYAFMEHWMKALLLDKGCPRSMIPYETQNL